MNNLNADTKLPATDLSLLRDDRFALGMEAGRAAFTASSGGYGATDLEVLAWELQRSLASPIDPSSDEYRIRQAGIEAGIVLAITEQQGGIQL